jgi:hypothetical protein
MKYLPLVWAAIRRKPARAILTLLSVVVAFTLFGIPSAPSLFHKAPTASPAAPSPATSLR